MSTDCDAVRVAEAARRDLELAQPPPGNAYRSLSLCVIDAVYSINAKYEGVRKTVERYCAEFGLEMSRSRNEPLPERSEQDGITQLLNRMRTRGDAEFAEEVLKHRGRTSTKNGILKAEAVRRFAEALAAHGVEHLQDVPHALRDTGLEREIRRIPGQGSGISLKYFFMEAGCEELVKPDRMVQRYLEGILRRPVARDECQSLLSAVVEVLRAEFCHLTPRLLDSLIWQHEREAGFGKQAGPTCSSTPKASGESRESFWTEVRRLRRDNHIPRQWRVADIGPFMRVRFSQNSISTIPFNESMSRDGKTKGDYVKKGRPAQAYRVGRGLFELVDDPRDTRPAV